MVGEAARGGLGWLRAAALALLALACLTGPARAESPCAKLFLPAEHQLICTVEAGAGGADDWQLTVRPADGKFGWLTRLTIRPVSEPVPDPKVWLQSQLKLDVSAFDDALTGLMEDEDSPFWQSELWAPLASVKDMVTALADLPLEACEPPAEHGARGWQIACDWGVGPVQQFLQVRLVERSGQRYGLRIETMNPRRYKHLVAIANSF